MTLGLAAAVTGLPSCVGDLDLEPTNPNEITNVSGDMDSLLSQEQAKQTKHPIPTPARICNI